MRLPVSTRQVASIVKLPPPSTLRAAPMNFLAGCGATGRYLRRGCAAGRHRQVISPGQAGDAVEHQKDILARFHHSLGDFQVSSATRV